MVDMTEAKFRIAMRVEEAWWVAYYCKSMTSLEGALPLARVHMVLVENKATKDAFIKFCTEALSKMLENMGAVKIEEWDVRPGNPNA